MSKQCLPNVTCLANVTADFFASFQNSKREWERKVKDAQEERDADRDVFLAKCDECLSRLAQRDEWASDCDHLHHHLVSDCDHLQHRLHRFRVPILELQKDCDSPPLASSKRFLFFKNSRFRKTLTHPSLPPPHPPQSLPSQYSTTVNPLFLVLHSPHALSHSLPRSHGGKCV
jgi:hypothetical protein